MGKSPVKQASWIYAAAFVAMMVWMVAGNAAAVIYYRRKLKDAGMVQAAVSGNVALQMMLFIGVEFIFLGIVYLFVTRAEGRSFTLESIGISKNRKIGRQTGLAATAAFLIAGASWAAAWRFGEASFAGWGKQAAVMLPILLVYSAFPGWIEEILFRGYIQARLNAKYNRAVSLIVTAVLFTVMHALRYTSLSSLLVVLLLGILLGLLYDKTRSILPGIAFHWAWDFLSNAIGSDSSHNVLVFDSFNESTVSVAYMVLVSLACLAMLAVKRATKPE